MCPTSQTHNTAPRLTGQLARRPYLSEACDVPRVPTKGTGGYVAQLKFVLPAHVQALGVRWVFVVICVEINQ